MNAIIGLSDLCLKTDMTAKQEDYLAKIYSSANALLGIINDILDFSKIEAGKLELENVPFAIDGILDNLATVITVKTQEKGLELLFYRAPEVPTIMVGDPLRISQVLVNLVNNAVKFTDKGNVYVRIELEKKQGDEVTLLCSVDDTGIGMKPEQLEKMFRSFSQADTSTTRKYGGSGLGLVICRQLVEMMGGEIWAESEFGVGSSFKFRLSLREGNKAEQKVFTPAPDLRGLKCLVVDDNETSVKILSDYLQSFSFVVEDEALSTVVAARAERGDLDYDLIVTDWMMPGLNGIELAAKIKNSAASKKQPKIVLVSAFHGSEFMEKPGTEHIDKFLPKPVSPSHLFNAVQEVFGKQVASKEDRMRGHKINRDSLKPIDGALVLLVEDNDINQQVASELLEQAGFKVDIANHGQEAIEMIAQAQYDIVLMDIQMPVMDGYTATQELRKDGRYDKLPILAMTANATIEDRQKSLDAGMNAHINKPINPNDLFNALLTWIKPLKRVPKSVANVPSKEDTDGRRLADLEGFDTDNGVDRLGGNEAAYWRVLDKFSNSQSDVVEEIRSAVAAGEQELAVRIAHSLKGAAGSLGVLAVQEAAGELEQQLEKSLEDISQDSFSCLGEVLDSAISLINSPAELSVAAGKDAAQPLKRAKLTKKIRQKLSVLQQQLNEFDSEAEDTLEELLAELKGSDLGKLLQPVHNAISSYEMDSAAEKLTELVDTLLGEDS